MKTHRDLLLLAPMGDLRALKAAVLFVLILSLFSGGCGKDETPAGPASDTALVGNWKLTQTFSEYQGAVESLTESQLDSMDVVWTLRIENNGTVEQTTNLSGSLATMPGTWSASANQLTLVLTHPSGERGRLVYEYIIAGNRLKLNWAMPTGAKLSAEFAKR